MTIIVEDGSIVTDANSYASVADLDAYAVRYGVTLPATEAEKETLLFQAMDYLAGYAEQWKGERVSPDQELSWPRNNVYVDGQLIPADEVPRGVVYGQLAGALEAIDADLLGTMPAGQSGAVIEERIEGAITMKYANQGKVYPVAASAPVYTQIKVYLKSAGQLRVVRA